MYCRDCGKHVSTDAKFCGNCGAHKMGYASRPRPLPPSLHWSLVLVFTVATLGLFGPFWLYWQWRWVKTIDQANSAFPWIVASAVCQCLNVLVVLAAEGGGRGNPALLYIPCLVAAFKLRKSLVRFYDQNGLRKSVNGLLTFLFVHVYLQYHLTNIARLQTSENMKPIASVSI
jgi:zinc-ribbon domain